MDLGFVSLKRWTMADGDTLSVLAEESQFTRAISSLVSVSMVAGVSGLMFPDTSHICRACQYEQLCVFIQKHTANSTRVLPLPASRVNGSTA